MPSHNMNTVLIYVEKYKKWVTSNPQLAGDIESTVKWLSYFTAGRINNSTLMSELVYSMSNLLVLFNDRIINANTQVETKLPKYHSKIRIWLTVLEYSEVLLEISASKLWGETGKWLIIVILQAFKSVMRLLLVHRYKERVTQSPPIPPIKRDKISDKVETIEKDGFALKRSKKVVRKVNSGGCSQFRSWAPIPPLGIDDQQTTIDLTPNKKIILAETLYIIKPLLHLGCLSVSGQKQWKSWFLSLIIDLASLKLYSNETKAVTLRKEEFDEISRRRVALLLYILRSPFYDNYSRMKIYALLKMLSRNVPLARMVTDPIIKYLPHWQSTYFYMWSS
ncbi:peroxisomal membrane protein PEX16 [Neodiprion fabricii]|uniref:peroxisomal membrane protein PEX16 n=1 Tax=Neodiprion fabricii TaxID=2872261 RepID=UPI001ED9353B|nr:peroxisomal membrane protein PEX16 [Neodiprion fabricii]